MAKAFRPVDRDQAFLIAPDMREWLPARHLVWFVLDAVAALDMASFRARYRLGGVGRAAYDPMMMLGLLIYAYAVGERSSRQIERLCHVDVAFRVACAQDVPDHATIARFRKDHEQALADLFEQILRLCVKAGMGRLGTVALDGTKIAANAALAANRSDVKIRQMVADMLAEAGKVDDGEDAMFGQEERGDDLAPQWRDPRGRAARLKQAFDELVAEDEAAEQAAQEGREQQSAKARVELERLTARLAETRAEQTRRAEVRAAREAAAAAEGTTIPGTRPVPVEQHSEVRRFKEAVDRAGARLDPIAQNTAAEGEQARKRNLTDPQSRIMKTRSGWLQAYNGQLVVSSDYLIVGCELSNSPTDVGSYQPTVEATEQILARLNTALGTDLRIGTVLADAGYDSIANLTTEGPDRLIAHSRKYKLDQAAAANPATGDPPEDATARQKMDHRLRTAEGAAAYKRRGAIVEPVNGHLKDRRGLRRFSRRGQTAARSEFRFAAAVTNLLRLDTYLATAVT